MFGGTRNPRTQSMAHQKQQNLREVIGNNAFAVSGSKQKQGESAHLSGQSQTATNAPVSASAAPVSKTPVSKASALAHSLDKWSLPTYQKKSSKEKAREKLESNVRQATKKLNHAKRCLDRSQVLVRKTERRAKERLVGIELNPGPSSAQSKFNGPSTKPCARILRRVFPIAFAPPAPPLPHQPLITWEQFESIQPLFTDGLPLTPNFHQMAGLVAHDIAPGYFLVSHHMCVDESGLPQCAFMMRRDDLNLLLMISGIEINPGPDACPYLGQTITGEFAMIKNRKRVICPACRLPLTTLAHSRGKFGLQGLHPGVAFPLETAKGKEPSADEGSSSSAPVRRPVPRPVYIGGGHSVVPRDGVQLVFKDLRGASVPLPLRPDSPFQGSNFSILAASSSGSQGSNSPSSVASSSGSHHNTPELVQSAFQLRPHTLRGFTLTESLAMRVAKAAALASLSPCKINLGLIKFNLPKFLFKPRVEELQLDNQIIEYRGERRPIQNRSVEPIKSDHDARNISALVRLSLSPKVFYLGSVCLGACAALTNSYMMSFKIAVLGASAMWAFSRFMRTSGQVEVAYAPALVTAALMDLGRPGPMTCDNIEPTLRRLGSMPLNDVDALNVHKGSALVCEVVATTPSSFFLYRPPLEAAHQPTLTQLIEGCLRWAYGRVSYLCPFLPPN